MSDVPGCCVQCEKTVTENDIFISEDFQNVKKSSLDMYQEADMRDEIAVTDYVYDEDMLTEGSKEDACNDDVTKTQCSITEVVLDYNGLVSDIPKSQDKTTFTDCGGNVSILANGKFREDPRQMQPSTTVCTNSCCQTQISQLKMQIKHLQRENCKLKKKLASITDNTKFLNTDQHRYLESSTQYKNKGVTWSVETLKTAFQMRFICGVQGYEFVRHLGYPLPAYRTLCNRITHAQFKPGIQSDVIKWLYYKLITMRDNEKECSLMLDEMQVRKSLEYDKGLCSFIGCVTDVVSSVKATQSSEINLASHVLVFMVRGVTTKWKQVVAYYLTGDSVSGAIMWNMTRSIIGELAIIGANVKAIVSDMGSSNRAMWKVLGVQATKDCVKSSIDHPFLVGQELHFIADIPHVLKNIRNCLLSRNICLPANIQQEFDLSSSVVSLLHVRKLVDLQENSDLKIAPTLHRRHVDPKQFQKMKVGLAAQLLSHSTASALRFAVEEKLLPVEALTTAWFIELLSKWFEACNARCCSQGLHATSADKINTLLLMLEITPKLSFSNDRCSWKPIQTGILISTTSILNLYAALVASGNIRFLLTSRLTQDALENLFSQIRGRGNSHPSPVHLRHSLRLITISQFMTVPKRSNYDTDDSEYLVPFIKPRGEIQALPNSVASLTSEIVPPLQLTSTVDNSVDFSLIDEQDITDEEMLAAVSKVVPKDRSVCESNALYYMTGWLAFKLKRVSSSCSSCITFLCTSSTEASHPEATLTSLKCFGGLTRPSECLKNFIFQAEDIFVTFINESLTCSNVFAVEK